MKNITIDRAYCVNRNYELNKLNVEMHHAWKHYDYDKSSCRGLGLQNIFDMFYDIMNDKLFDAYHTEEIADKPLPSDLVNIHGDELSASELNQVLWAYIWAIDIACWGIKHIPCGHLHETSDYKPLVYFDDYKYECWFSNLEYEHAVLSPTLVQCSEYISKNKIRKLKEYVDSLRLADYIDSDESYDKTIVDNFYDALHDFHLEVHDIEANLTSGIVQRPTEQEEYYMMLMVNTTFCYNALQLMLNDICYLLTRFCYKN